MMMRQLQLLVSSIVILWSTIVFAQTSPATNSAPTTGTVSSTTVWIQSAPQSPPVEDEVYKFYSQNLRSIFFTGLLTLSSFLLAANTFIVINLKKEVYDSKGYVKRVRGLRENDSKLTFYGPLKRLSLLLLWNIRIALAASICQVTVGILWKSQIGAYICIATMGAAVLLLFVTLAMIGGNLHDWFNHMEDEAAQAEAKDKAEELEKAAQRDRGPKGL